MANLRHIGKPSSLLLAGVVHLRYIPFFTVLFPLSYVLKQSIRIDMTSIAVPKLKKTTVSKYISVLIVFLAYVKDLGVGCFFYLFLFCFLNFVLLHSILF